MPPRLPETIDEMKDCLSKLVTNQSVEKAINFQAKSQDIFIATYPKSGTTWMQQIVHGLRTDGAMNFGEIAEVVPWLEACSDLEQDMNHTQVALPRAFKTHLNGDQVPKGARYIYIMRDPKDVLLSFYHFFEGFMFQPGSISIEEFCDTFFVSGTKSGQYWQHIRSWWSYRDNDNALLLTFESLKQDLAGNINKVARFLDIQMNEATMATVLEQSSFAFMSKHNHHFDEHFLINKRRAICNLPNDVTTSKVHNGKSGASKLIPSAISEQLDKTWTAEITDKLGFDNYETLRAEVDALSSHYLSNSLG